MATTTYTTFGAMIVGENRNGQKRDYMPDTLGSTAALLDNAQVQTSTWKYWPYGEVRSGGTATQFLFVGTLGYRSDDTSRAYVRARESQKLAARWMQVDPLWPLLTAYVYVNDGPTSFVDPLGLEGNPLPGVDICKNTKGEYDPGNVKKDCKKFGGYYFYNCGGDPPTYECGCCDPKSQPEVGPLCKGKPFEGKAKCVPLEGGVGGGGGIGTTSCAICMAACLLGKDKSSWKDYLLCLLVTCKKECGTAGTGPIQPGIVQTPGGPRLGIVFTIKF